MDKIDLEGKIRRSIFTSAVLGTLLVGILVALVSIWPFYNDLKQSEARRLLYAVKSRAMTVHETLSKMEQVALQVTTRSRMRDILEDYNQGKISKAEYIAFTKPKLADPLSRSEDAVSIARIDLHETVTVTSGIPIPVAIRPQIDLSKREPQKYGPFTVNGKPHLLIFAPILNRNAQRVGTDLVLFGLAALQDFMQDKSGLGETGEVFLGRMLKGSTEIFFKQNDNTNLPTDPLIAAAIRNAVKESAEAKILSAPDSSQATVSYSSIDGSDWALVVKMDNRELYAAINRQVIWVTVVIIGLLFFGIVIVRRLLRPLAGKVLIHAEKLQEEIREKDIAVDRLKTAENNLTFSNAVLTCQMEASLDGILVVSPAGEIISYNQHFPNIWNIPAEILSKKTDQDLLNYVINLTADPEAFINRVQELYASTEEKSREIIHLKDGRILDRYSSPMIGDDDNHYGRIWFFRDITEQERLEQELLKIEKLESIGVLAGGLAHDFNNILAAILGNLNLALRRTSEEKVIPLLKTAEKASLRAKGLTRQLLTFSKGGAPVKNVTSIDSIIKDAAEFVLRGSKTSMEYKYSDDLALTEIDQDQIAQVIQNITLNASHAMPEGGVVSIDCSNEYCSQGPNSYLDPGDYVRICISDTGVGIPKEQIGKIFDPYHSTKETGSGLGLSICHSIISKHHGHISVESRLGAGTTFCIYLPAYAGRHVIEQIEVERLASKGSGLIMVMDDDEMLRETTQEMLLDGGYQVLHAANGEEALEVYQSSDNPIVAIIMDLTIPGGMGGQEAVRKILEINPDAKVIVSSGYSHDPVIANYQDYGFVGAIEKPYTWQELEKLLRDVLPCT